MTASPSSTPPPDDPFERCLRDIAIQPENRWPELIDEACGTHPEWREPLQSRLQAMRDIDAALTSTEALPPPVAIGPYRLIRQIGRGGMGIVWLAEHVELRRKVALKLLAPGSSKARFVREALLASKIDHPAICPVHEAGEADGHAFLAMRYLEGETLAAYLTHRDTASASETRAEIDRLLQQFEALAQGLHAAHERALVHRDVKPGNVFLTRTGEAMLLDFGLARDVEDTDEPLTMSGDQLGTPPYMAPEQVRGASKAIDARTDVYALGVTLYEALSGTRPFDSTDRAQLYEQILRDPPPNILARRAGLPAEIRPVLEKALAKQPTERFATASEFGEQLRRIRMREPISVRGVSSWLRARRWAQRNPLPTTVLVLLSAGLTLTLLLVSMLAEQKAALTASQVSLGAEEMANRALFVTGQDPLEALRIALSAYEADPGAPAPRRALATAMARLHQVGEVECPRAVRLLPVPGPERTVLSLHNRGPLRVWITDDHGTTAEQLVAPKDVRIRDAAVSDDGRFAATASDDGLIRVYDLANRSLRWTSPAPPADYVAFGVAFAPASTASADTGYRIGAALAIDNDHPPLFRVWDDGADTALPMPPELDESLGFYPPSCVFLDRDRIACSTSRHTLVWNLATGAVDRLDTPRSGPLGPGASVRRPEVAGDLVLVYGQDGDASAYASVHDAAGERLLELGGHLAGTEIRTAALSPDGSHALTGAADQQAFVTEIATGRRTPLLGHNAAIYHVAFSASGHLVLTADQQGRIRVFDLQGRQRYVLYGHGATVRDAHFLDGDARIVSAALDDTIRVFDLTPKSGPLLRGHAGAALAHALGADERTLITAGQDGRLLLHDLAATATSGPRAVALDEPAHGLTPHPRRPLVAVSAGRALQLVNLETARATAALRPTQRKPDLLFRDLAWTPDGSGLYACEWRNSGVEGLVRRFDLDANGTLRPSDWRQELPRGHAFALHPSGSEYVVGTYGGQVRIFGLDGEPLPGAPTFDFGKPVTTVRYSPDGRWLAALSRVSTSEVRLWRRDGSPGHVLTGNRLNAGHVAFAPDSTRLVVGGPGGDIVKFVCADGSLIRRFEAHDGLITDLGWSVTDAGFAPAGRLMTSSSDGTTRFWHAELEDLVAAARAALANSQRLFPE